MNNKQFIQELAQRTGYTQDDVQKMVFTLADAMNEKFQEGDNVVMQNFGTFEVKKRLENACSPKTCVEFQARGFN